MKLSSALHNDVVFRGFKSTNFGFVDALKAITGTKAEEEIPPEKNETDDFFTKDEQEFNEGKVQCDFKEAMLGNQVGRWFGDSGSNRFAFTQSLHGKDAETWRPEGWDGDSCENVTNGESPCWHQSHILNDHNCTDDQHCLHTVVESGDPLTTFTCPTYVKIDGKRCALPMGWQACPEQYTIKGFDSGVPQALEEAQSTPCGVMPDGRVLEGTWVFPDDKSHWDIQIQDNKTTAWIPLHGHRSHADLLEATHGWYEGDIIDSQGLPIGTSLRVRLNKNGEVESETKPEGADWGEPRLSYRLVHTTGGDGGGEPCIFPFVHDGEENFSCVPDSSGKKWCMTSTEPVPGGKWGYCKEKVKKLPPTLIGTHGGTPTAGNCYFPFMYKGKSHDTCTTKDEPGPWCRTDHLGNWGFCNCEVPEEATPGNPIKTHSGSIMAEQTCHFPFTYKGKEYNRCISDDERAPWCFTDADNKNFGFCNCKQPADFVTIPAPVEGDAKGEEVAADAIGLEERCLGSSHNITNPIMIFDLKGNNWYRCSFEYKCEPFDIRAIKKNGKCGDDKTCPEDESCFIHRIDSKRSSYECVPKKQIFLVGTSDESIYATREYGAKAKPAQGEGDAQPNATAQEQIAGGSADAQKKTADVGTQQQGGNKDLPKTSAMPNLLLYPLEPSRLRARAGHLRCSRLPPSVHRKAKKPRLRFWSLFL